MGSKENHAPAEAFLPGFQSADQGAGAQRMMGRLRTLHQLKSVIIASSNRTRLVGRLGADEWRGRSGCATAPKPLVLLENRNLVPKRFEQIGAGECHGSVDLREIDNPSFECG